MKPLTLQEAKDQVAKNYNAFYKIPWNDWNEMETAILMNPTGDRIGNLLARMDEAAQLFGDSQWNAALESAIEKCNALASTPNDKSCVTLSDFLEELKRLKR